MISQAMSDRIDGHEQAKNPQNLGQPLLRRYVFYQRHPADRHLTSVRHESDTDTRLLLSQDTYLLLLFVIVPIFPAKKRGTDAFFGFMSKSKVPTTVELRRKRRGGIWYSLCATRRVCLLVAGSCEWFPNGSKCLLVPIFQLIH